MNRFSAYTAAILIALLTLVFLSGTGCYSSGGKDLDPTTTDTCSIAEVIVLPEIISISTGEALQFNASAYSFEDERIVGGPQIYFSSSSHAVYIHPTNGQIRAYAPTGGFVTITATAYDCTGRPFRGQAKIQVYSDSPGL